MKYILILPTPSKIGIVSILHMRKLRFREGIYLPKVTQLVSRSVRIDPYDSKPVPSFYERIVQMLFIHSSYVC